MNIQDFTYRADDLEFKEARDKYIKSKLDERIITNLISRNPILIEGSRGSGKTMLMKVAEALMMDEFEEKRILPVYVSFKKSMMVNKKYFLNWMLAKTLIEIKNKIIHVYGYLDENAVDFLQKMFGLKEQENNSENEIIRNIQKFIDLLENSWETQNHDITELLKNNLSSNLENMNAINQVDYFIELLKYICNKGNINRIVVFFDEVCHNFLPDQQREFFNMFRDLRCPYIICKAAVYPGITSYGGVFQLFHDADLIKLNRTIENSEYIPFMRDIIRKQVGEIELKKLEANGDLLDLIIYSSSGNPRILLKSINKATEMFTTKLKTGIVNNMIKEFYRTEIWNEHSELLDKYVGHKELIEWGRDYIEDKVVEDIREKNSLSSDKKGIYFGVDRDKSKAVDHAIKILEYSGIVSKYSEAYKKHMNQKNRLFDRYQLNLGIVLASEKSPSVEYKKIVSNLSLSLCKFYTSFPELKFDIESLMGKDDDNFVILGKIISNPLEKLDLTEYQKQEMKRIGFETIGDLLRASKEKIKKARYIGDYRAQKIIDSAVNATLEYISG